VPAGEAPAYVERLVAGYLAERVDGETFQAFATRKTDEELIALASGQVAVAAATGGA
jgi:sulfite reductase beta subunit-like hemoprotein